VAKNNLIDYTLKKEGKEALQTMLLSSRKAKFLTAMVIGFLAWALVLLLYWGNLLETYELKTYDQLCRLHAAKVPAPDDVVLIVVDQGSLQAAQRQGINWPWPRQMYAPIVQFCASSGARAIAFDVLFTEPSSYGVEDDRLLEESLRQNRHAFLPIFLSRQDRSPVAWEKEIIKRTALPLRDQSGRAPSAYASSIPPLQNLANSAIGLGNVAIPPDADGIYRRLPLVFFYREQWIPSLGLALFRHLEANDALALEKDALRIKDLRIPLDNQGTFLLSYYSSTRDYPRFSAFNVIQSFQALQEGGKPIYPPQVFRDKIVLVGFTAAGLYDMKPTPISAVNPGMAIHATLVANLLHKDFRVRISPTAALTLAAAIALVMSAIVMFIPSLWQLGLITLAYAGGLFFCIQFAFRQNIWVDGILLSANMGIAFAIATAFSYATEGRQRRQIKQVFSHYMSDLLIQDLLKNPEKLRLGGEKRVLTVFFSDLAGFTSLSEKLTPEEVVTLLNRYLTAMTDIILASGGLIDKYEGDAIMAFWGAPLPQEDHALRACIAALDNQTRLAELRQDFIKSGLPPVHARIGLNTGEMIIGNMGSSQRFDFTVIGDSVNLASRLEGAGKEYGTSILISEETYLRVSEQIEARELDLLRVKGKEKPVRIYELLCRRGDLEPGRKKGYDLFAAGLEQYRKQRWEAAVDFFLQVLKLIPEDGPAKTFIKRCEQYQQTSPAPDWEGVYALTTK
jgi:adenylate cyclase